MSNMTTRVLLVEDEDVARKTLAFYLNTIFDEVVLACDGEEGFSILKENIENDKTFDLVLTDLKMPNVDGMGMIDLIREVIPNQRFIIVSAHKNEEDLLKLINLRVLGYFLKPLNIDNMMEMLKKAKEEVLEDKKEANINTNLVTLNKTYTYDLSNDKLYNHESIVKLSKKELDILQVLIKSIGEVISVEKFKEAVWNDIETNDSAFRTVMKRLKDKVIDDDFIVSHKGYGYIIEKPFIK
ncbi:response regulator transcription factor [Poseidonibacter ostreae]|jgi:DNA-binding response OmpR family regulator|uniref:Response regulator n=1 Tax=Poseidonibacter ostreae TaxID=2654171 RepID=A0A6L4WUH7_9BACT|nr:response regulator transcription factor [Poseidonibacter ostreae]KAB7886684.1 response regulator [Poseidonibacter ostreae]KAB7889076.1 response regulator [Poseidonibacter ostreae]KAB7891785.1 response regulator [Poseidonibacter ostreae]MAC84000.1 transcriptional regulator [Arcobacter sp.]